MDPNKQLLHLGFLVFLLNGIWEFAHHFLYIDLSGIPKYPHLILASFVDMLIILIILGLLSIAKRSFKWLLQPTSKDYLIIISLSILTALFLELINLKLARWAYTEAMPTIGVVGLSPLIQLAATACLSLYLMKKLVRRSNT